MVASSEAEPRSIGCQSSTNLEDSGCNRVPEHAKQHIENSGSLDEVAITSISVGVCCHNRHASTAQCNDRFGWCGCYRRLLVRVEH
jgi:hypothetical protein